MKTKILFIIALVSLFSCSKFLDQNPQGALSSDDLNTSENIEKMVIAAYSALGNEVEWTPFNLWPLGSLRGGDAYKGGDAPGDNVEWYQYETFITNQTSNPRTDQLWSRIYEAIGRINDALIRLDNISEADMPNKKERIGEMRFLRGHFYFLLKIVYKYFPYIDEVAAQSDVSKISNRQYTNDELWDKIAEEFKAAVASLPGSQTEVGRPTKSAAHAYLAKTYLYKAYKQDDNHNVTSIDAVLLQKVVDESDSVINSGKYALNADFAYNFIPKYENSRESIFAVQYSTDDGTPLGRVNMGYALNYPMNQEYGCCGLNRPSQNLVNSFKTDNQGVPQFNTYNNTDVTDDPGFQTNTFDPRLDHTVAIPNHPFKYSPNFVYQKSWARSPQLYGYYHSLKELVAYDDPAFQKVGPFMGSALNFVILRYDDVLLWKAEALIELGKQNDALPLINQIRFRAANSTGMLKRTDGTYTSNYKLDVYKPGINITLTQAKARETLRWERRLEFAMEGSRFFDLIRWGIAAEYINDYFKRRR